MERLGWSAQIVERRPRGQLFRRWALTGATLATAMLFLLATVEIAAVNTDLAPTSIEVVAYYRLCCRG